MNSLGHRLDAISPDDLEELLVRLNRGRCVTRENCDTAELESYVEENFHSSERLAVYGSLAPGRENHTKIEHLGGTWQAGRVRLAPPVFADFSTYGPRGLRAESPGSHHRARFRSHFRVR